MDVQLKDERKTIQVDFSRSGHAFADLTGISAILLCSQEGHGLIFSVIETMFWTKLDKTVVLKVSSFKNKKNASLLSSLHFGI